MAPWFGPKRRYDTGIASWQGLAATVIFLLAMAADQAWFRPAAFGWPAWTHTGSMLALAAAFGLLVWVRYDRDPV